MKKRGNIFRLISVGLLLCVRWLVLWQHRVLDIEYSMLPH